jgi:pentapeptide repeat protein
VTQDPRTAQERAVELLRVTLATHLWLPDTEGRRLVWAIRCALALGVLILVAAVVEKGLWDWLGLLVVPAVLAIGGYLFNSSQNRATEAAAERRAQDEALQAYLDHMSDMLTPSRDQPSLYEESSPESLRVVARARPLTVLRGLDGDGKGRVLQFLQESGLIEGGRFYREGRPVRINLSGADLSEADLSGADLSGARLPYADLTDTKGVTEKQLADCESLEGATMPDGQTLYGEPSPDGPTFEEWLKSKGRGEDGENSGPT